MIPELLQRAVQFFRLGRGPQASTSFATYLHHADHIPHALDEMVVQCMNAGDYLRAADVVAYGIAPLYA